MRGVLHCLYKVLLYADGEDAVLYAEAAHLASVMIDESVEQLDSTRIKPLIDALKVEFEGSGGGGFMVREPPPPPGPAQLKAVAAKRPEQHVLDANRGRVCDTIDAESEAGQRLLAGRLTGHDGEGENGE